MRGSGTGLLVCGLIGGLAACQRQGPAPVSAPRAPDERPVAPTLADREQRPAARSQPEPAPAPPEPAPVSPEPAPASLFDSLTREFGAASPLAIVPAADGVVAVALQGEQRKVLVAGPVRWLFVDDRTRVVWFQRATGSSSELWGLDLTSTAPIPERILTGLPKREQLAVGYTGAPGEADDIVRSPTIHYDGGIELWLDPKRPSTRFVAGIYDQLFEREKQHRRAAAKATIVSEAVPRLQELALRGRGRRLLLPASAALAADKIGTVDTTRCEEPDLCGTAERISGTGLLRVLVEHSCGDACHVRWQIWDPQTSEFVDFRTRRRSARPIDTGPHESMSDAFVSPNGEGFVIDGDVFLTCGGRVFQGKGSGGGWLGGQSYIGQ